MISCLDPCLRNPMGKAVAATDFRFRVLGSGFRVLSGSSRLAGCGKILDFL